MTCETDQCKPQDTAHERLVDSKNKQEPATPSKTIAISKSKANNGGLKLNHFTEQPHWLRDNHYLHNNHRAPTESYMMCLKSCFALHTETMNIW